VDELRGLALDRIDYTGMAMPRGDDGDSRGEIQKPVAVDVLDDCALATAGYKRVAASVGGRHDPAVTFNDRSRARARKFGNETGKIHSSIIGGHYRRVILSETLT
jgi:hypothetical protein